MADGTIIPNLHKAMLVVCNLMNQFLLIVSVLIISLSSCGQSYKEYNLQDIGLHIKIPKKYLVRDTFPKPHFVDVNGKQVTDSSQLKDLEAVLMKGLLIVSSVDHNNTVSFNLATETEKTGNFKQYYAFSKNMQQLIAKQQMVDYDSTSSILTTYKMSIYKFLTYSTKTNPIRYSGIYLAKVKRYFLVIKADYTDKKFGDDMEKAVLTSKSD